MNKSSESNLCKQLSLLFERICKVWYHLVLALALLLSGGILAQAREMPHSIENTTYNPIFKKDFDISSGILMNSSAALSASGNKWDGWGPWTFVPNASEYTTNLPLTTVVFNNQIYLFEVSNKDHRPYMNIFNRNTGFAGWSLVPGVGSTNLALGATVFRGEIFLFGVSDDFGAYFLRFKGRSTEPVGWQLISGPGTTKLPLTATTFNDRLYLFAVGVNKLKYMKMFDGTNWGGWQLVAAPTTTTPPKTQVNNQPWTGPRSNLSGTTNLPLTATVFRNKLYLFGVNEGDRVECMTVFDGKNWSDWKPIGAVGTTDFPLTATVFNNRLHLLGVGDRGMEGMTVFDGLDWSGWYEIGGEGTTSYALTAIAFTDRLYLFGISDNLQIGFNSMSPLQYLPSPPQTKEIETRCLASWDDNWQPHSVSIDIGSLTGRVTWKKLRHCIKLTLIGPVDFGGVARDYVNQCIQYGLNNQKVRYVLQLLVSIIADVLAVGGTASAATVADYANSAANAIVDCLTDSKRITAFVGERLKEMFDASVEETSEWIYWDI